MRVSSEQMRRVIELYPPSEQPQRGKKSNTPSNGRRLDVPAYLAKYGVECAGKKSYGESTLYLLKHCVFDASHTSKEAAIGQQADGKLFYQCFHDSCQGRTWRDARQIISGDESLFEGGQSRPTGSAEQPGMDREGDIQYLAKLSPIEYDQVRKEKAKELGVRTSILDDEVRKLRQSAESKEELFEEIEPWPEEVNGATLLNEIREVINSHLVIQQGVDIATSLWVVLTYCFSSLRILPLLGITSPVKRCGKTTFAEVLQGLVFRPVIASNISSAVLYRLIEKHNPTMMVDEADTFLVDNDELRGVFNAGHTQKSAFVWRVNTETLDPERFSVWGPKVVLMIGSLPGTMDDRSIRVRMRRKAPGETVKKLSLDFEENHLHIRRKCARWCKDNPLSGADPDIPNVGNDRASDNWAPLLAVASKAGGEWPELARSAMLILEHDGMNESDSAGQMLLADIKKIFDKVETDQIFSDNLVGQLVGIQDRPWCEWKRGKPLTQNSLSKLLKPFGIRPKQIRSGEKKRRGYVVENFQDSFKRYLPSPKSCFQGGTTVQRNDINVLGQKQSGTRSKLACTT